MGVQKYLSGINGLRKDSPGDLAARRMYPWQKMRENYFDDVTTSSTLCDAAESLTEYGRF